jgi:hypothetical protein
LCSSSSFIRDVTILPPIGESDHNVVMFTPNISYPRDEDNVIQQKFYNWKNADYTAINDLLQSIDWNLVFQTCFSVEACWTSFMSIFNAAINHYVPVIDVKKSHKVYPGVHYPQYIKNLIRDKAIAWKRSKISRAQEDKATYKLVASKCAEAIKKYHAAKELELIRKANLGSFYNFVNNKLKSHNNISEIRRPDNTLTGNSAEICCIFNNFFASVFTADNGVRPEFVDRVAAPEIGFSSVNFFPHIIERTLKHLKPTTSTGPDGIPNILLKRCAQGLAVPLSHVFDTSFKDGSLPECWKFAEVLPIHKKGQLLILVIIGLFH